MRIFFMVALAAGLGISHAADPGGQQKPETGVPASEQPTFSPRETCLPNMVRRVPEILSWRNPETGIFEACEWTPDVRQPKLVNTSQYIFSTLAVLWATKDPRNPYYQDQKILDVVIRTGNLLVENQTPEGKWLNMKPDGSTWGYDHDDFLMIRWLRVYGLVRDALPPDVRASWERALQLTLSKIYEEPRFKDAKFGEIANHPLNAATALFLGGKFWDRQEWIEAGRRYIEHVIDNQDPEGFFWEGGAPATRYGGAYVEDIGIYYALTGNAKALEALKKCTRYYWLFTFPNGHLSAVMDGRRHYHRNIRSCFLGFGVTPEGRALMRRSYAGKPEAIAEIPLDSANGLVQYDNGDSVAPPSGLDGDFVHAFKSGLASVRRQGKWLILLSAHTAPGSPSRWMTDMQNHIDIYHDDIGLILGGGGTKAEPLWSTFSVGDINLVKKPGKGSRFPVKELYPEGLHYLATKGRVSTAADGDKLELVYGDRTLCITVSVKDPSEVELRWDVQGPPTGQPQAVRFTFVPEFGRTMRLDSGEGIKLDEKGSEVRVAYKPIGGGFSIGNWSVQSPADATLYWPVIPYNEYKETGKGEMIDSRIVLENPVTTGNPAGSIRLKAPAVKSP